MIINNRFSLHYLLLTIDLTYIPYLCIKKSGCMYILHNLWMILCTIYRAKYIIWTICHHGIHKSHWDIDVTWMDINMDINICMKASYFGFDIKDILKPSYLD
jgi:hypothetical protein